MSRNDTTFATLILGALAAALLLSLAPSAHAEENAPQPYVGGALGASHFSESIDGIGGHTEGVNGKVYAGLALNPYVAVETGWADLGHTHDTNGSATAHGGYLALVGMAPVGGGVSLLGSVGVDHARFETTSGNDAGNGLMLGLGAQADVARNVAVRAEVDRYQVHAFDERPDIHQFTVGVALRF